MLYYALKDTEIVETLLATKTFHSLPTKIGLRMSTHPNVDEFGHSGFSINQTLYFSQEIIINSIEKMLLTLNLSKLNM